MILFLMNLLLALVWTAITGAFSLGGFLVGFILGYAILWLVHPVFDSARYLRTFPKLLTLIGIYLVELVLANLRLAMDVITPKHYMRPAIVAVPLRARTGLEITLLSNLITMTPGSMAVELSADRRILYVHVVYCDDVDDVRRRITDKLEARLLEVLR